MPAHLLVLGRASVMQPIVHTLASYDLEMVEAFDDAADSLAARRPDAIVLAYHFDGLRPFRLIQHVRGSEWLGRVPILLIRVIPIGLGTTTEVELEEAYRGLGVNDVLDYAALVREHGRDTAALELKERVARLVRGR